MWTKRNSVSVNDGHNIGLQVLDSFAPAGSTYAETAQCTLTCNVQNAWLGLSWIAAGGNIAFVQGATANRGNDTATFNFLTCPFVSGNLPGSTIIVIVGFTSSSGLSAASGVTDSQGNTYVCVAAYKGFGTVFHGVYVAVNCVGGANNIVSFNGGGNYWLSASMSILEYQGLQNLTPSGAGPSGAWGGYADTSGVCQQVDNGISGGGDNTYNVNLTSSNIYDLFMIVGYTDPYCGSVSVTGPGNTVPTYSTPTNVPLIIAGVNFPANRLPFRTKKVRFIA
jgi:hypothetical protein